MKFPYFRALFLSLFFLASPVKVHSDNSAAPSDDTAKTAEATPLPTASASAAKPGKVTPPLKALFIHKPMPSPSWGKVIQYHRDQILALSEKNREILHEFLFQDDQGVIRTATFHENASGEGYWEVWIWDQP